MKDITGWENVMKNCKKDDAIESYQNALLYDKNYTEARDALDKLQKINKMTIINSTHKF